MFRRPGKNPLEDYKEENTTYNNKYEPSDVPPRIFDTPHQHNQPLATPMSHEEKASTLPHHFQGMVKEDDPETTLGEGVTFRGELSFDKLLRIDGTFEGELLSQGKVVIGPTGKVKADLNLREAIIEGSVEGNVTVQEKLELRGEASIKGDIKAKLLSVDEGVEIIGVMQISANPDTTF
ncbi:MAG: hypothetical protein S4CHLAM45_08030 [Chlamydiales bacterium]|nr:hypothetical protein [Chlamydiales bacterium]MCH9619987.1 hypothetical protein [Chlamydiales bacterium]MCH9622909.1 hypothetical protein [Chlamydiales bacterium]